MPPRLAPARPDPCTGRRVDTPRTPRVQESHHDEEAHQSHGEGVEVHDQGALREPVLLSGGNPQIPKADGDAPVQAYIAAMPGWKHDVGRHLDALIAHTIPRVRKAVRWNSPFYGVEGSGWFLSFHCFAKYVKVAFHNGGALRPQPPGESKHPNVRYLHIHEDERIDDRQFSDWVKQASKLPGEGMF